MDEAQGRPSLGEPWAKRLTLAILPGGLLLTLALNLPGQMSYDSIVQLADGRSGLYHTWHPPIMAWLLGLGDWFVPGTALYVTGVATLIFAAFALSISVRREVSWAAPVVALLICLSPLMLMDQGVVWKDILFADVSVGGFLLLSVAARVACEGWSRRLLAAGATALFALAALTRQNGLIIALFGMGALGFIAWRTRPQAPARPRLLRSVIVAGAGLAVILACTVAATLALSARAEDDAGSAGQLRLLKIYDLVGAAKRYPALDLAPLEPAFAAQVRAATAVYTPQRLDAVGVAPGVPQAVEDGAPGLDAAWRGLILHHPIVWLRQRLDVFHWMIAPPDVSLCLPVYTGVDGPLDVMAQLKLKPTWRGQDLRLARYAELFEPTPLYIHAVWAVVAVGLAAWLARTGRGEDTVLAVMLAATLAFTASFLLIGVACDHRYLYALDLATMAALLNAAAGARWPLGRSKSARP